MISSEEWSSSSKEEEIPAKVLRGDGRVCGTCGVRCRGGSAHGVRCCGVCGHGVHCRGGNIRGSFHIRQVAGHGEDAEVGCNEEDIDGLSSEGAGDKHVDEGGDFGRNEEGNIAITGNKDSENENADGSSKDEVGEHIEEGEGVIADDGDGEDNEDVDDGPVDNVGARIGVCGGCSVCGSRGRGHGGNRKGRNNNNINIEQCNGQEEGL